MTTVIRVSVCLNSGPGKGKAQATILLKSNSTESLLSIAANKLRLTKKDVSIAKLYVWQSGIELPRHEHWSSGIVFDDALIAIAIRPDEVYAGLHRGDVGPSSSLDVVPSLLILPTIISELLPPPVICGVDDIGNTFTNLMELWSEQAIHRTSYYTANSTFWNEDGYAGSADEEAMIGDATTSVNDVIHSLQLIDNIHADHPTWIIRNALDCGAGVGRVTKHVLLKRCNRVCLLEGCERWFKQIRRYLGKKRSQNCKFVLGQLEECSALEACCQGDIRSSNSRRSNNGDRRGTKGEILFDLIWIQWTLQYLIDADVVSTLLRMRSALTSNGRLIIKENRPCMHTVGTTESFQVDMPSGPNARYDVCRPDAHHRWLFRCALLVVEHTEHYGEISAWVLRASTDPTTQEEGRTLLQPTLDAVAMATAAKKNRQVV
jgi:protein N-terminal methyltransferase